MAIDKAIDSAALHADLKGIADSIRTKGGTSAQFASAAAMKAAVDAIKTGNDTSDATATAADIMHDTTAYIASGKVTGAFNLDTELAAQDSKIAAIKEALKTKGTPPAVPPVIQPIRITRNGTTTAPEGVDGYSPVVVTVPSDRKPEQTYTKTYTSNGSYPITPDTGKVIKGGSIIVNTPIPKPEQSKTVEITANGDVTISPDVGKVLSEVIAKVNVPTGGGGGEEWCNVTVNTMASVGFYGSGTGSAFGNVINTFPKGFNTVPTTAPLAITFDLKVLKNSIITIGKDGGFPNISVSPNLEYKLNRTVSQITEEEPPIMLIYVKGDGTVTA